MSVFWISKSKSAFVNYKTGEALLDAMSRFHESRFEGVRLVCRARKTDIPIPTPVVPTTLRPRDGNESGPLLAFEDPVNTAQSKGSSCKSLSASEESIKAPLNNNAKKRFFVMKSLTREDLELSVQNGHWITQEHNETTLNEAFAVRENHSKALERPLT